MDMQIVLWEHFKLMLIRPLHWKATESTNRVILEQHFDMLVTMKRTNQHELQPLPSTIAAVSLAAEGACASVPESCKKYLKKKDGHQRPPYCLFCPISGSAMSMNRYKDFPDLYPLFCLVSHLWRKLLKFGQSVGQEWTFFFCRATNILLYIHRIQILQTLLHSR